MRRHDFIALVLPFVTGLAGGCSSSGDSPETGPCDEAQARLGYRPCVHRVDGDAMWTAIAGRVSAVDQVRTTRFLVPARDGARLPTLFADVTAPPRNHFELLSQAFGGLFPALTQEEYDVLTTDPSRRELFGGTMTQYLTGDGKALYGYLVWDKQDQAGTVTCDEARRVQRALADRFAPAPLAMVPATGYQRTMLASCDLPTYDASTAVEYESYNAGAGYGTVRRYTLSQFEYATATSAFGWQDILVLDEAPIDIERVVSGIITGTRQGELSHLAVRSATRKTPNCYTRGALARLAQWEGKLVKIDCGADDLTVEEATPADAQAWWASIRPSPVQVPVPDFDWTALVDVQSAATTTPDDRALGFRRFGGKGQNIATAYQRIDPKWQMPGFMIPFTHYRDFLRANGLDQVLAQNLADPAFRSDAAVRRRRLLDFEGAILNAPCDAALLAALATQIRATFGSESLMVRFRSSSNSEDGLAFNGHGLYTSENGCLADELDADLVGPSRCDPDDSHERGLCTALRTVWSSLWTPTAYDERDWYGIDQSTVAMAVLADVSQKNEQANIVAFTGNPLGPDKTQYLVDAQVGAFKVVSAIPGVWPEKDLLSVADGQVTAIARGRGSSQLPPGQPVLSDEQLRLLASGLFEIVQKYPIDWVTPPGKRIILDMEWKVRADGRPLVTEIRPYLDTP